MCKLEDCNDNSLSDADLIPGNFYHLGLQIRIVECFRLVANYKTEKYWDWFVYGDDQIYGTDLLAGGESRSEAESIEAAKKWIGIFLGDG